MLLATLFGNNYKEKYPRAFTSQSLNKRSSIVEYVGIELRKDPERRFV